MAILISDFTLDMFEELKDVYEQALIKNEKEFFFRGELYVTEFGKHMIEFLENKFKQLLKQNKNRKDDKSEFS